MVTGEVSGIELNTGPAATFAGAMATSSMSMIELARAAETRAVSPAAASLASEVAADHSRMLDDLAAVTRTRNIPMAPELAPGERAEFEYIMTLDGARFDEAFVREVLTRHLAAVRLLEVQAADGSDPLMQAFAGRWLPIERRHAERAQDVLNQIGVGKAPRFVEGPVLLAELRTLVVLSGPPEGVRFAALPR